MKTLSILVPLLAVALPGGSQQQNPANSTELMTIIVTSGSKNKLINISGGERGYEQKREKAKEAEDYTEVLATVNQCLKQGWQVKSSNYDGLIDSAPVSSTNLYSYFLL